MSYSFSGKLTAKELEKIIREGVLRKTFTLISMTAIVVMIVFFIIRMVTAGGPFPAEYLLPIAILLGAAVYLVQYPGLTAKVMLRKRPEMLEELSGEVSEEGVRLSSAHGSFSHPWSAYQAAKITADLILIFRDDKSFNFLLKSFFADPEDWDQVMTLVHEKIKSGALKERS